MQTRSLFAGLLLVGIVGCAKNGATANSEKVPSNAEFDRARDPAINANTHFAAGQLAESRGDFGAAVSQYQAALKVNPQHQPSLYRLAVLYTNQKAYAEAITYWKKYVKATDESAGAYSNLALCEELSGRPEIAEADYRRGVHADPKNEQCRVNYGLMLARHGRISEATVQLQAVLSPAEIHYDLASVYQAQGRREEAKREYRKSIELNPELNDAKARLASLE